MHDYSRNWNLYNNLLVNRGRPSTYIKSAVSHYKEDLLKMNDSKVGHPYSYTNMLIISAFAVKSVFKIGYREAAGTVADYTEGVGLSQHPDFRTIHWRISKVKRSGIKFMIYSRGGKDLEVVIDSSGIKSTNDGEYRSTKYGKIKVWKKIHIAMNPNTHKILNIIVTENDVGDSREFMPLMNPIEEMNKVSKVIADGAHDSEENFKHCDDNGIDPKIPVHINATGQKGWHRRKRVEKQLGIKRRRGRNQSVIPAKEIRRRNQNKWKEESGYHKRSLVETVLSVFKSAFGEYTFSKTDEMKEKELLLKAVVYNRFLT